MMTSLSSAVVAVSLAATGGSFTLSRVMVTVMLSDSFKRSLAVTVTS